MTKFFLSSHGRLASGIGSSLDILLGGHDRLTCFDSYIDEHSLNDALDQFFQSVEPEEQVILLSDMYLNHPNTTLVTGVNLALVIGLIILETPITRDVLDQIVTQSREAIRIVELEETDILEENEELF